MCVGLDCVYLISSEGKKKILLSYSIFIPAWPLSPAAHFCLLQAMGGQAGTNPVALSLLLCALLSAVERVDRCASTQQ